MTISGDNVRCDPIVAVGLGLSQRPTAKTKPWKLPEPPEPSPFPP